MMIRNSSWRMTWTRVVCAGIGLGAFWLFRALRLAENAGYAADTFPTSRLFASFLAYGIGGIAVIAALWLALSWIGSRCSGNTFAACLQADSVSYLPCAFLIFALFSRLPFDAPLLKTFSVSPIWFGMIVIAACSLNMRQASYSHLFERRISPMVIFSISLCIYGAVGAQTARRSNVSGDEPHYLLIAHSIAQDHDLDMANNYRQQDYLAFHPTGLTPHISIAKDGARYPGHPLGLPLLIAPAYALFGVRGAIVMMNLFAALLALQIFLLARDSTGSPRLALMIWALTSLTLPVILYSSRIYPEIPSALLLITAYRGLQTSRPTFRAVLASGMALAALPWLHQRMILPAVLLVGFGLWQWKSGVQKLAFEASIKVLNQSYHRLSTLTGLRFIHSCYIPFICLLLSGGVMAAYSYAVYGNPLPTAPYASVGVNSVFSLRVFLTEGVLGHLFDQEAGLLIYAPYYAFAFPGFLLLFKQQRARAIWLAAIVLSLYIPTAGFTLKWRGAWSPATRYMTTLLPCLIPLLCVGLKSGLSRNSRCTQFQKTPPPAPLQQGGESAFPSPLERGWGEVLRHSFHYLFALFASVSLFWTIVFVQSPVLALMQNTGQNPLFQHTQSLYQLVQYFPSFPCDSMREYAVAGFWLVLLIIFSVAVYRPANSPAQSGAQKLAFAAKASFCAPDFPTLFALHGLLLVAMIALSVVVYATSKAGLPSPQASNQEKRDWLLRFHQALTEKAIHPPLAPPRRGNMESAFSPLRFEYLSEPKTGVVNQKGERFLVNGPYEFFPKGKYTAYFEMAFDQLPQPDDLIATCEITGNQGKQVFYARSLRGNDIAPTTQTQRFPVAFELQNSVPDLETRVYFHNRVNFQLQRIVIEPDLADVFYQAGLNAQRSGDVGRARALWEQAGQHGHALASYQFGRLQQQSGEWEASLDSLRQTVALQPNFADAYYRMGSTLLAMDQSEQAKERFEQAVRLLPAHFDAWYSLSQSARTANDSTGEQAATQQMTRLYQPEHPLSINFANQMMLLGYTVKQNEPNRVTLEYWWKALAPMHANYVIFTHFSRWGRIRFQADSFPKTLDSSTGQETERLTSSWQIGEVIRTTTTLPAPSGTFTMSLGVWDPEYTQQRLPILSSPRIVPFSIPDAIKLGRVSLD